MSDVQHPPVPTPPHHQAVAPDSGDGAVPPPNQPQGYVAPSRFPTQGPVFRKQGAWALWWLVVITCGIYYYVWYHRINRELSTFLRRDVPADGQWWCQLIPIYNLIGLARTAKRVNEAHAAVGSPTRVSSFVTWFWAPAWFASQTRYLQRRINILHDIVASKNTTGW
jgi:hypothetical protein